MSALADHLTNYFKAKFGNANIAALRYGGGGKIQLKEIATRARLFGGVAFFTVFR